MSASGDAYASTGQTATDQQGHSAYGGAMSAGPIQQVQGADQSSPDKGVDPVLLNPSRILRSTESPM